MYSEDFPSSLPPAEMMSMITLLPAQQDRGGDQSWVTHDNVTPGKRIRRHSIVFGSVKGHLIHAGDKHGGFQVQAHFQHAQLVTDHKQPDQQLGQLLGRALAQPLSRTLIS